MGVTLLVPVSVSVSVSVSALLLTIGLLTASTVSTGFAGYGRRLAMTARLIRVNMIGVPMMVRPDKRPGWRHKVALP